jgi:hypothetical protein
MANIVPKGSVEDKTYLIKKYQDMFQKISQKRVGLDESEISLVKTPFIKLMKKGEVKGAKKKRVFLLEAIFGNKVMINGSWYSLYQSIDNYKIVSISGDSVFLKGKEIKIKLTLRKRNANITIK